MEVTRSELNGLGLRVSRVEICTAEQGVNILNITKEADKQRQYSWEAIEKLRIENASVIKKVSWLVGALTTLSTLVQYLIK